MDELFSKISEEQNRMFESQNTIEKQKADIGIFKERINHNTEKYESLALEIEKHNERKEELTNLCRT